MFSTVYSYSASEFPQLVSESLGFRVPSGPPVETIDPEFGYIGLTGSTVVEGLFAGPAYFNPGPAFEDVLWDGDLPLPVEAAGFTGEFLFSDVNGDGLEDLIAHGRTSLESNRSSAWVAYAVTDGSFHSDPGQLPADLGDGQFESPARFSNDVPGEEPAQFWNSTKLLDAKDIDGDGRADLVGTWGFGLSAQCPQWCPEGALRYYYWPDFEAVDAVTADVDGDGNLEIAAISTQVDRPLKVVHINPDSVFAEDWNLPPGEAGVALAAVHLDDDGVSELAVTSKGGQDSSLSVLWPGAQQLESVASGLEFVPGIIQFPASATLLPGPTPMYTALAASAGSDGIGFLETSPIGGGKLISTVPPATITSPDCDQPEVGWIIGDPTCDLSADLVVAGRFSASADLLILSESPHVGNMSMVDITPDASGTSRVDVALTTDSGGASLPPGWIPNAHTVVTEIDGDDRAEAIGFGPNAEGNGTVAAIIERNSVLTIAELSNIVVSGSWPRAIGASLASSDYDADGSPDFMLVGHAPDELDDPVFVYMDGASGAQTISGIDQLELETWSFAGPTINPVEVVVAVEGTEAVVGSFDVSTTTFVEENRFPIDAGTLASVGADFDGDGLGDVVFVGDSGVHAYFGQPEPPTNEP
jgi:hypothetical protein